ncbi:MAG: hypothetical protein AB7O26_03565 [Planctomycetaceae bacterium]
MSFLLADAQNITWYILPLAVVISLCYSASRYELPEQILRRAARLFVTIILFMGIVLIVLSLLSFRL